MRNVKNIRTISIEQLRKAPRQYFRSDYLMPPATLNRLSQVVTVAIPKKLIEDDDLVIIPRKRYEEFLGLAKVMKKKSWEERDTDFAIKIYQKEKNQGKLRTIKSLAELD